MCISSHTLLLFVQVLSNSVAKALKLTGGPDVEKTAKFASMFDKFFDCLNVSNFEAGKRSRNSFKSPYYKQQNSVLRFEISVAKSVLFVYPITAL